MCYKAHVSLTLILVSPNMYSHLENFFICSKLRKLRYMSFVCNDALAMRVFSLELYCYSSESVRSFASDYCNS